MVFTRRSTRLPSRIFGSACDRILQARRGRMGGGVVVHFGGGGEMHFDQLFNINGRGTLFTVQKALPLLNDGGSIILNGSVASVKGTAAVGAEWRVKLNFGSSRVRFWMCSTVQARDLPLGLLSIRSEEHTSELQSHLNL